MLEQQCIRKVLTPLGYIFTRISEKRKEMFYITTHLIHFYLWLYSIGHTGKDHLENEGGNPLPTLHGLLFSFSSKEPFKQTISQTGWALLDQLWTTGWNEKQLNGS